MSTQFKRTKRRNDFEQIQRSTLQDSNLSFGARGLLVYLLSLPENLMRDHNRIAEQNGISAKTLQGYLKELRENGYLEQSENSDGGAI